MLLFAHPRSGSSNLYEILQSHPVLDILEEPFNENFVRWRRGNKNYRALVRDVDSLDAVLEEIFTVFNGVKVLNYQLPDDLLERLLLRSDLRIVFLRRRNVLQAVVSNLIALQTNLWKKWDMNRPLASHYEGLEPLDIADVRSRVTWMTAHLNFCESIVDRRDDGRAFKLTYEELYFATPAEQAAHMHALWHFLELEPLPAESLEYYLRPEATKLNSAETYAYLPNAREINAACGSDVTGWLFEDAV